MVLVIIQPGDNTYKLMSQLGIIFLAQVDKALTQRFNSLVNLVTGTLPNHITQNAAQQTDMGS
ncbi:hypothetical protein COL154_013882 [Colletotrichum chrysophilum]|nr:hypothetical protein COL154_013882 [Colletotrichum chrysophilum]